MRWVSGSVKGDNDIEVLDGDIGGILPNEHRRLTLGLTGRRCITC